MSELKFRFWNSAGKVSKMFYDTEQVFECLKQQALFNDKNHKYHALGYDHEANGSAFMQYTGINDKNGKEIYEGDIIREEIEFDEGDERMYFVCRWFPQTCSFVWMSYGDTCTDWETTQEEYPISLQSDEKYIVCGNEFEMPDWWQKD